MPDTVLPQAQKPAPLDVYGFVPSAVYRRKKAPPPPLSEDEILAWADAWHARTGKWPNRHSGLIPECPPDTWGRVNGALVNGGRGLLGDSSLTLLLWQQRDVRHPLYLPPLTQEMILEWADAFYSREGKWPGVDSGPIPESPGDDWQMIRCALVEGRRGLPGGITLSGLLVQERGIRHHFYLPPLTEEQILEWADAYHFAMGTWPNTTCHDIVIDGSGGETWGTVHGALSRGGRGQPGGSSLPRLLEEHRGVANIGNLPPILEQDILAWADAYFARHGEWPVSLNKVYPDRCLIPESPGVTWGLINGALSSGLRGLPGGSSLALLLEEQRGKRHRLHLEPYTVDSILAWADAFYAREEKWPVINSGLIPESAGDTWASVEAALANGSRGLPGGTTLVALLAEHRGKINRLNLTPLTEKRILKWADAYHKRTGAWPTLSAGPVRECQDSTWATLNAALQRGGRGLAGGTSLALMLAEKRGAVNIHTLPDFTEAQILEWADAYQARHGQWPTCNSLDEIPECPGENWRKVSNALRLGLRGLEPGPSLTVLLEQKRGRRNCQNVPRLSEQEILSWADAYHASAGKWPTSSSGPITQQPQTLWLNVDTALMMGLRGLPGGSSLPRLLHEQRGVFNIAFQPPLKVEEILAWADAHFTRTGEWPHCNLDAVIVAAPTEKWSAVNTSLQCGNRGLPGGSSIALLLQEQRGRRSIAHLPPLSMEQVLAWADAHHARTGKWPECLSTRKTPVTDAPDETWDDINGALMKGNRGFPGGSSLARLLREKRGKRYIKGLPPLTVEQILGWADEYYARTGKWPASKCSDPIPDAPGEAWLNINTNLTSGDRGLPGGSSLALLLEEKRGKRIRSRTTPLTEAQIAEWARAHRQRTGQWPMTQSGEVVGGDGTLWAAIDKGLRCGSRGLPGGSSLKMFCLALDGPQYRNMQEPVKGNKEEIESSLAWAA